MVPSSFCKISLLLLCLFDDSLFTVELLHENNKLMLIIVAHTKVDFLILVKKFYLNYNGTKFVPLCSKRTKVIQISGKYYE